MGIANLSSYVSNIDKLKKDHSLHNTSVVIDGKNVFFSLYDKYNKDKKRLDFKLGGNYVGYEEYCKQFFGQLRKCRIKPLIVMSGVNNFSAKEFDKSIDDLKDNEIMVLKLMSETALSVITDLGLDYLRTAYGAHWDSAKLANQLKSPIITRDADFYCLNVVEGVINLSDMSWAKPEELKADSDDWRSEKQFSIKCKIFKIKDFLNLFPGLSINKMAVFGSVFTNYFPRLDAVFGTEEFKNFIQSQRTRVIPDKMVEGWRKDRDNGWSFNGSSFSRMKTMNWFLKWLSTMNGDSITAITWLKIYLNQRETTDESEKNELSNQLNKALTVYGFNKNNEDNDDFDTYLKKILDLKQKNSENADQELRQLLIEYSVLEKDSLELPDHFLRGFFLGADLGKWIFLLTEAKPQVKFKLAIEDVTQTYCVESCIELIRIIAGLLRSDGQTKTLRVKYSEKSEIKVREVLPAVKYPIIGGNTTLPLISDLNNLSLDERKILIFDLLGVSVEGFSIPYKLEEELEFWSYFVINVKYWKNKTSMDNKCDLIEALILSAIYYQTKDKSKLNEVKDLTESPPTDDEVKIKITHYYNEFQLCCRLIRCLNSILGFPIGKYGLHSCLNGTLISRLIDRKDIREKELHSKELNSLRVDLKNAI